MAILYQACVSMLRRYERVILLLVLLMAAVLRFWQLGERAVWVDEAHQIFQARLDLATSWYLYLSHQSIFAPIPIYSRGLDVVMGSLMHPFIVFWGDSAFSARLIAAFSSILSVAVLYRLGRDLFGFKVALIAVLLIALSPFQIWYAQTVHPYAVLVLFTLLSFFFLVRALREDRTRDWLAYILCASASVWAHPFGVLIILSQNLFVVLRWLRPAHHSTARKWLLIQMLALLLWLPFVLFDIYLDKLSTPFSGLAGISVGLLLVTIPSSFYVLTLGNLLPTLENLYLIVPAGLTFGLLFIYGLAILKREGQKGLLVLVWFLVPLLAWLCALPLFTETRAVRNLIILSGAYSLIIAIALTSIKNSRLRTAVFLLVVLLNLFVQINYYRNDYQVGLKESANYIRARLTSNDAIVHLDGNSWLPFKYYLGNGAGEYIVDDPLAQVQLKKQLADASVTRLWFVSYELIATRVSVANDYFSENTSSQPEAQTGFSHALDWAGISEQSSDWTEVDSQTFPAQYRVIIRLYQREVSQGIEFRLAQLADCRCLDERDRVNPPEARFDWTRY